MAEEALVARIELDCSSGQGISAEVFDDLVRCYQGRVYRVLFAQLQDADAAATLTQECFLRAYRKRESFRGDARVSTWLLRIALNLAKDYIRNRRQSFWRKLFGHSHEDIANVVDSMPSPFSSPEKVLLDREQVSMVESAVEGLSPQQRAVFTLRFVEEMSLEEIAQCLSLETGTVKAHLSRAVGNVRRALQEKLQ
jgi:RNA polymerase sigma-70 factor (ECF subfamily)